MQTTNVAAETGVQTSAPEPPHLRKRIGSTLFEVSVRFSEKCRETMEQKMLRMIEREVQQNG
ncbi:hypothetical protein FACS1894208_05910 [Clostridia bacterium]|nr:hypothetical protein FACS1894208_05910 [Clostridia bacterium]